MRFPGLPEGAVAALCVTAATLSGCAGNDLPVDATPDDILAHAEAKLADGKYFDAAETLEYFLRSNPGTAATPLAKLRLGDARYGLDEYILAEGEYQQIVSDFPASPFVEEARYKIALCSYAAVLPYDLDQSETSRTIRLFEEFRRDYPDSRFLAGVDDAVRDCRDRLAHGEFENGRFYQRREHYKPASIQYKFIVEAYSETAWASKAALSLAEMYTHRERWQDAANWYRRVVRDWPGTEEAALADQALSSLPERETLSQVPDAEEKP